MVMNLNTEIPFDIPIKEVILQAGIAERAENLSGNFRNRLIICDENTQNFVNINCRKIVLPKNQKAELAKAQELAKNEADLFIAVGSGTVNDLTKYAAFLAGKSFICFATAASMNGYASTSASLLDNGYKKSFLAKPAQAIYFDSEIIKNAPKQLTNSGVGDSICRPATEADAILSAQITGSSKMPELFSLLKKYEDDIFDDVEALIKTLFFGGVAMLAANSSAPASQGEHMIAHYMELMNQNAPHSYHGEQIAVTTVTMLKLQEQILARNYWAEPAINKAEIIAHFGAEFGKYCLEQTKKKYSQVKSLAVNAKEIEAALIKAEVIEQKLQNIGAPTKPEQIGWDKNIYQNALKFTKYTRDRLTFLDFA